MLPKKFANADESALHKRFACRPNLILDLKNILKCPWGEVVILKGEPTIGKAELVRWSAALLRRDFIYVPCNTASTVLSILQEIIRQLEQCHQQHDERGNKKVKCSNAVEFIDGLKDNQAHATIVLITDKCRRLGTFHPDLPQVSTIHFDQYTTTEAKEVLANYCPVDGCEQSWTAFVDEYLDGFTLKSRHFESLKLVMQKAYAAYTKLASSVEETETVQRDFLQLYKQMVLEFTPAPDVPLEPKDLPTVDEVLAMSLPQQVMITALVAASWTKPQADGRILDNIQQQHRMSKKYMWYLFRAHEEEQVKRDGPQPVGLQRLLRYYAHFLHIVSQKPINIDGSASQDDSLSTSHFTSSGLDGQLFLSHKGEAAATAALKQLKKSHLVLQCGKPQKYLCWMREGMAEAVSKKVGLGDFWEIVR
ncbi:TPA: hypothetical protein ACH3X3_012891 [Trebouxia sp. C0006]